MKRRDELQGPGERTRKKMPRRQGRGEWMRGEKQSEKLRAKRAKKMMSERRSTTCCFLVDLI